MAGEDTGRKRRSARYDQPPERVEQAAARSAGVSSINGFQRGYTPASGYPSLRTTDGDSGSGVQNPTGGYAPVNAAGSANGYGVQNPTGGYAPVNTADTNGYGVQNPTGGYAPVDAAGWNNGYAGQNPGGGYPNQNVYHGQQGNGGQWTGSQQKYYTASNNTVGTLRGYVAEVQAAPPEPPKKKKNVLPVIAAVLAVMILGAGGAFAAMSYSKTKRINDAVEAYNNLFVEGVYVDGIHLGGMTPEQALNSVQSRIQQRNDAWSVTLTWQGQVQAVINAGMLAMSVDIGEVMNNAWLQGHEGDYEQRYAAMEALKETPYQADTADPSGDTSVINDVLAQIKSRIDLAAVNAEMVSFDPSLSYPFTFSEERVGRRLDTAPVIEKLYEMVSKMESGTIELEPEAVQPRVTVASLQKHYALRSSAYTPISTSSTEERNKNIARAFELINGYVINPGTNFSFNSVVGERTEANGFYPAEEYAYTEHIMGIGGGVCQASTTLYQAAVYAGLQIVKREPHSDAVSYTKYGMDATVYWQYKKIDLVFKNNTTEPIYIIASVQSDPSNKRRKIAKVTLYGEDLGDVRYEMETEVLEEIPAPLEPEYVKDKKAEYVTYTDQEVSVKSAKPGYVVRSYRLEYIGNVLNERKELYTDTYKPQAEKIYVGVKKRETK